MKKAAVIIITVCAVFLCGCNKQPEIGDMAVILGVTVSQNTEGGLTVSVELAHRVNINSEDKSVVVTAEADCWQGIEEELSRKCDKKLYWGHMVVLLLSADNTPEYSQQLLESLYCDLRMAPLVYVAFFCGNGEELLEGGFGEAAYASQGMAQRLKSMHKEDRQLCLTLQKCMQHIYYGRKLEMAVIELADKKGIVSGTVTVDEI